jgi:hypothetical protein
VFLGCGPSKGEKKMKRILLTTFCLLLASTMLLAGDPNRAASKLGAKKPAVSSCPGDPLLIPDGTTSGQTDFIAANSTNYYFENFQAGHSYAAQVWDPFDSYNGTVLTLTLLASCAPGPSYTDVSGIEPNLTDSTSDRISWIQPTTTFGQLGLNNSDTVNGYAYYVSITDTTLLNPRWSTFSGFITQYAFVNNTSADISGTLTLTDSLGNQYIANLTVPAGGEIFETTGGLGVPAGHFGFANFAFIGPAGAVTADAYFINPSATVIVPSTFAPRNYQH